MQSLTRIVLATSVFFGPTGFSKGIDCTGGKSLSHLLQEEKKSPPLSAYEEALAVIRQAIDWFQGIRR